MHKIYQTRSELVALLGQSPSFDLLQELFKARTQEWPYPYIEVEGGGITLFGDLTAALGTDQAFALRAPAVQLALEQTDEKLFETSIFLILELAKASQTTEVPEALAQSWDVLTDRCRTFVPNEDSRWLDELRRWYRVK